ncbi:hypothetical protein JQS43_12590 [Natronosporangium hydrolyticum]|uniref:Uncharacterized protein n=1 Tax=Natronosporangium hydrolyticum TaxID=2811111 RepID=A0A895Y4D5_9ACTN|nr:hypothetical protein [Natronosporangium hydrolyticum]QSB12564.1 hypothetical protein JQS43_12590 [Natronosporangium hydrolyticum]
MHDHDPPAPPRPSAGFTWPGLLSIVLGFVAAVVVVCGGAMINAIIVETGGGDREPGVFSEADNRLATILSVLAALAILGGCLGAVAAARRHNLRRGEISGRPRPTFRVFLSPRALSRLLFTPRDVYRIDDQTVARIGRARSWLGVAVFASVIIHYQPAALVDYAEQVFIQTSNAIVIAAVVLVMSLVVALLAVHRGQRGAAARAMTRPILAVIFAGSIVAIFAALSMVGQPAERVTVDRREDVLALFFNPLALWPIVFLAAATYYIAQNMFNSADAHPLLAPLITIAVTWTLAGLSLLALIGMPIRLPVRDLPLPIPTGVATVLTLVGAMTVTAVGGWEISRLRQRGLRLRRGPWR